MEFLSNVHMNSPIQLIYVLALLLASVNNEVYGDELNSPQPASAAAARILDADTNHIVSPEELKDLRSEDYPALRAAFRERPLRQKKELAWAIAQVGGDNALEVLREPLELNAVEDPLGSSEIYNLTQIIAAIGYLGQRSAAARQYLHSRISPESWGHVKSWPLKIQFPSLDMSLTEQTLGALAISRYPEIKTELNKFIVREGHRIPYLATGVLKCVFYDWYIQKYGMENFIRAKLNSEELVHRLFEFYETDEGRQWDAWRREKLGLPPPPRVD